MGARHEQGHRAIALSRTAYWQAWLPEGPARAIVVIVHGIHEHSGRYAHVGSRLATAGFAAYAADHRGHGRSGGRRANIERMALIVDDLSAFVRFAAQRHTGLPVFMIGHSLGGLIALHWATEQHWATEPGASLDGLVLSGPAVEVLVGSALARRLAGVLSALVPDLRVAAIDAERISRDPEVVRAYREDPLVDHGRIKARTGAEILATIESLPARLPRLSMPLLLLHGTDDQICAPTSSVLVHDAASSPDKTLRRYQGLYHDVFNEPERDQILTDLITWLNDHLRPLTHSVGSAGSPQVE